MMRNFTPACAAVRSAIIGLCLVWFAACEQKAPAPAAETPAPSGTPVPDVKDIANLPVKYSYMASCQMRCSKLKPDVVKEALAKGAYKTKPKWMEYKPCPLYAVSYKLPEDKKMIMVIATCPNFTKVLRVVHSDKKDCNCKPKPDSGK